MFNKNNQALQMLETDWLRNHVESHLILGYFAKHIKIGWLLLALSMIGATLSIMNESNSGFDKFESLYFIFIAAMLISFSRYHSAAMVWCVLKFCGALIGFLFVLMGIVGAFRGQADAIPIIAIGAIWFPHLELIPEITKKQKYVTISRAFLTIPFIIWGLQTGRWHW